MGGVFLAAHVQTGERVALKVVDPRFIDHDEVVARLYGERAVSAHARHPGLVHIRAAARNADHVPYLVMEYLEGETLAAIRERGELSVDQITELGAQIASALAALHAAGYVHCDVKPDNVLVLADGRVKIIDFGVSRRVDEPPQDDASIAGTPAYMAPEQWRGEPSPASDVYALGCMLFELLTGETPFDGSLPKLMWAHLESRPARPSWLRAGIGAELERVVLRALAKDSEDRPTMVELAQQLGATAERDRVRLSA
jgi:serine/threonine-protein kinase